MPSYTLANRCFAVLALILFQANTATADEVWMCTFTEIRIHEGGHDDVIPGAGPFFLRIKPAIVEAVVANLVRMSFSISENTQAKLIGTAHFDLEKGATSDIEIALDKHSGRVRQTGHISIKRHVSTGTCSKSATGEWPPGAEDFTLPK